MAPIEGIYAAAVTPRRKGLQEIDLGATWELFDFLTSHKVDGIVLMGSTGEFVNFSIEERNRLVHLAAKRSRVPVWVNVSHATLDGAIELAQAASIAGAAGLLLMPPYYFRYRQEEILAFYRGYATAIGARIPTLLYHIPVFNNGIFPDTAAELLAGGGFAGIKDSSGDWANFSALKCAYDQKPFALLIGDDRLFAKARAEGIPGGISGVASALPELLVALNHAVVSNHSGRIATLNTRLMEFIEWLGFFPVPVGVKEAAALRGIQCNVHAVPLSGEQKLKLEEFRGWFQAWLPQVQRECAQV
jgi:dihydrodipicolinate synthase/N-acetylneuraminate lyase